MDEVSLFERVGGQAFFDALVARFYEGVAGDPLLRPLYPEADLAPAARRLALFLGQYWGGPPTYSQERGHPRLRLRHAPFPVDAAASEAWLAHMDAALDALDPPEEERAALAGYFRMAAEHLRNVAG